MIGQVRDRLAGISRDVAGRLSSSGAPGNRGEDELRADNVVWIFGNVRTGSTWLGNMMGTPQDATLWNEPRVGEMFGHFYYNRAAHRRENNNFVLGDKYRKIWLNSIRSFVLDSAEARYPGFSNNDEYLVIKEPSGSIGAPLLMEALPESRMVLLVRDPRDVVASAIDAAKEGSWAFQLEGNRRRRESLSGESAAPDRSKAKLERRIKNWAQMYVKYVGNSKQAFEAHAGRKSFVRYEDLVEDTLGTMQRLYRELEVQVDGENLEELVRRHSWENIPEENKGEGKFYRKGKAGSWQEDLTEEQVGMVEEITAPLLKEFYPE